MLEKTAQDSGTSMKGGRTAPRNEVQHAQIVDNAFYFNEGGADCPPKLAFKAKVCEKRCTSMKGGRTAPRNPARPRKRRTKKTNFNEGGADCPPKQPWQQKGNIGLALQ